MQRISTKMKLLSLAILGLGGIALAGSAAAQSCPSLPGAWTEAGAYQGAVSVQAGGLGGTSCRMDASIQSGAGPFAFATVHDNSPSSEPRYRAQFIIDLDSLANPTPSTGAQIINATSSSGGGMQLYIFGLSNNWYVSYVVPDSTQPTGVRSGSAVLAAGENHIEIDLQIGTSGSFTMWVNSNTEGSPTIAPVTVNDSSLVGIDDLYMGLAAASSGFVANFAGTAVKFDQFDSRRSTFIGY